MDGPIPCSPLALEGIRVAHALLYGMAYTSLQGILVLLTACPCSPLYGALLVLPLIVRMIDMCSRHDLVLSYVYRPTEHPSCTPSWY